MDEIVGKSPIVGKTLYIINPAGHGGAGIKAWEEFESNYPDRIPREDVIITERPGHAREIAVSADGTPNETSRALAERGSFFWVADNVSVWTYF